MDSKLRNIEIIFKKMIADNFNVNEKLKWTF
jgi:hypothetical protein